MGRVGGPAAGAGHRGERGQAQGGGVAAGPPVQGARVWQVRAAATGVVTRWQAGAGTALCPAHLPHLASTQGAADRRQPQHPGDRRGGAAVVLGLERPRHAGPWAQGPREQAQGGGGAARHQDRAGGAGVRGLRTAGLLLQRQRQRQQRQRQRQQQQQQRQQERACLPHYPCPSSPCSGRRRPARSGRSHARRPQAPDPPARPPARPLQRLALPGAVRPRPGVRLGRQRVPAVRRGA